MWLLLVSILIILATLWSIWVMKKQQKPWSTEGILLLSRFPGAGKTKTRLIGELGEAGAARAQLYMTDHILDVLSEFLFHRDGTTCEVKLAGGTDKQIKYWLGRKQFPRQRFSWSFQCNGHLGIKMADALNSAFEKGNNLAVLIGSDTPGINADILESALMKLASPDCEMVLGPAQDGGYYLVGFRREVKQKLGTLDDLFEGIEWSTSSVCQRQVEVATRLSVRVELLPQILVDVDTPNDLVEFEKSVGVGVTDVKAPVLSIVIPTLNEEANVEGTLQSIKENSSWISYVEVVVSDGGSTDGTLEIVGKFAERNPEMNIKTVQGSRGRGRQLNAGAQETAGVNLLFLHADTRLPRAFDRHVLLTLAEPGNVAGAFSLDWDVLQGDERYACSWLAKKQLQLWKLVCMARYKFTETAFGDHGMFMSRRIFNRVGRFPPQVLMEDYEMAKRLQRHGHLRVIPDVFVITSARRAIKKGILKVVLINRLMVFGYIIGIHPDTLGRFYYG